MDILVKEESKESKTICSICLSEQKETRFISQDLLQKLIECVSLDLEISNKSTMQLCGTCEADIHKWYLFKQKITKAVEILKYSATNQLEVPEIHIKQETVQDMNLKHECSKCKTKFLTHGQLRTHLKIHKMQEGYTCDECDKVYRCAQALWKHKRQHPGNLKFPCPQCPKRFPFKYHLDRHVLSKHSGEPRFQCKQCPRKYKNRDSLLAHVRSTHKEDSEGAICTVCGKFPFSTGSLNVHMRSHTGERPFLCEFCSKGFVTKDHLVVHTRIHTGDRPYGCGACDKRFISSSVLRKHARSHTGERPYSCHLCKKSFGLSSAFKTHLKSH